MNNDFVAELGGSARGRLACDDRTPTRKVGEFAVERFGARTGSDNSGQV